ncbi:MAG: ferritin-like domain-containing protein [Myxococcota bacterium]
MRTPTARRTTDLRLRYWLALGMPLAALPALAGPAECVESTVCGAVAPPSVAGVCGASGDRLVSFGPSTGISVGMSYDPALARFRFDEARTAEYRRTLTSELPASNYCCYSACVPALEPMAFEKACPVDSIAGFACGAVASPDERAVCGPTVQSLRVMGEVRLPYGVSTDLPQAGFEHDGALTRRWRDRLAAIGTDGQYCCYSGCTPVKVVAGERREIPAPLEVGDSPPRPIETCVAAFASSAPDAEAPQCAVNLELSGRVFGLSRHSEDECCYQTEWYVEPIYRHPRGRPLRVDDAAPTAPVTPGSGWIAPLGARPVDLVLEEILADAWTHEASLEHASVAAFSRLALQLMALGAPAELVQGALYAASEEVRHAEAAFALVAQYGGTPMGPGPFPEAAAAADPSVAALVRHTLLDGCVGEAVASEEARNASGLADDPIVAGLLAVIAEEEAGHAELAWRILAWLRETHRSVVDTVVREVRAELRAEIDAWQPATDPCCAQPTRHHGLLCAHERAELREDVIVGIVLPILDEIA